MGVKEGTFNHSPQSQESSDSSVLNESETAEGTHSHVEGDSARGGDLKQPFNSDTSTSGTFNPSPHVVEKETSRISSSQPSGHEGTFNLSSELKKIFEEELVGKITGAGRIYRKLKARDKTFIKKDTKNFTYYLRGIINLSEYWERRKELAGEELLK